MVPETSPKRGEKEHRALEASPLPHQSRGPAASPYSSFCGCNAQKAAEGRATALPARPGALLVERSRIRPHINKRPGSPKPHPRKYVQNNTHHNGDILAVCPTDGRSPRVPTPTSQVPPTCHQRGRNIQPLRASRAGMPPLTCHETHRT